MVMVTLGGPRNTLQVVPLATMKEIVSATSKAKSKVGAVPLLVNGEVSDLVMVMVVPSMSAIPSAA